MANYENVFHDYGLPDGVVPLLVNLKYSERGKLYIDKYSLEEFTNKYLKENNISNKVWFKYANGRIQIYYYNKDGHQIRSEKYFAGYIIPGLDLKNNDYKDLETIIPVDFYMYKPWAEDKNEFLDHFNVYFNTDRSLDDKDLDVMGHLIANAITNHDYINRHYWGSKDQEVK